MCVQDKMVGRDRSRERFLRKYRQYLVRKRGLSQGSFPGFWFGQLGGDSASTESEIMEGSGQLRVQSEGSDQPCQGLLVNKEVIVNTLKSV